MSASSSTDLKINNEDSYDDLLIAIEASTGILSLLIAVCDDSNLREEIIARYESELSSDIRPFRLTIPRVRPSLTTAMVARRTAFGIADVVRNDEYLQNGGKAVITITGVEQLYVLKHGLKQSEQEFFFWLLTMDAGSFTKLPASIVLWVTNQMLAVLIKKAADFWSWRKGVFRFVSEKN